MARLPGQQRTRRNRMLWGWVLMMLAIAGVIWGLLQIGENREDVQAEREVDERTTSEFANTPGATGIGYSSDRIEEAARRLRPVSGEQVASSQLSEAEEAEELAPLLGKRVTLDSLVVTRVVSERAFFVRSAEGMHDEDMLVVLGEGEAASRLEPGHVLQIKGVIEELTTDELADLQLASGELERARAHHVFLRAEQVRVLESPSSG